MYHNYCKATADDLLPVLMEDLLCATPRDSRVGRVKERTHVGITLAYPWRREILAIGRKPSLVAQIAETMWVLAGRNDVEWLERYLPRAGEYSDDGKVWRGAYGPRLRGWQRREEGDFVDQLAWILDLLRAEPDTRRAVIQVYDPDIDAAGGKDVPCNNWLSFYRTESGQLDLHVAVRSNDLIWGWSGINTFEWSTLLEVVAGMLGWPMGALHFSTTSLHIYERHWDRKIEHHAAVEADSPRFEFSGDIEALDVLLARWFKCERDIREGTVDDRQIDEYPEPMFRSWLRVLRWWWTGEAEHLKPLYGTRLWTAATQRSVQPATQPSAFDAYVSQLHREKDAVYGDSWCKRGEMLSILPNIARKVDRLGKSGAGDTAVDTAVDLLVYLAKYRWWLDGRHGDQLGYVDAQLHKAKATGGGDLEARLEKTFEDLHFAVEKGLGEVEQIVDVMFDDAYSLASTLYWKAGNATRGWNPDE